MKKIILLSCFILFFLLTITCNASDYYFIWKNTNIVVPLYGNLSDYIYEPCAMLYFQGKYVEEQDISYLRTGQDLYFMDDVDTSKVGKYQVMYKAYDYNLQTGNCDGYTQIITFNVSDLEAPIISLASNKVKLSYKTLSYDFLSMVAASDNSNTCNIYIDDSKVNYGKVGFYDVIVYANDGYNYSSEKIEVEIFDNISPILEFCYIDNILSIEYEENLTIDFEKYFNAYDEYSGNVIQSLSISDYNFNLGMQNLTAIVNDSNLNTTSCNFILEIKDSLPPALELVSNSIEIDYANISNINYYDYILNVSDNYSVLEKEDVIINKPNILGIGEYKIEYIVSDLSNNKTIKYLDVFVKTYKGPNIEVINPTLLYGSNFNIFDYVTITDDTDSFAATTLSIIDTNLNVYKAGEYYVNVSAYNNSGIYSYATIVVTVLKKDEKIENNVKSNENLILYSIICLIVIIGLFVYYKKSRRNS